MTFRDGWPPFYDERSVGNDFGNDSQWFLLYSALIFFVGFIVVSPGQRGLEKAFFVMRWTLNIFVGASIIATLQGTAWQVGQETVVMPYRPGAPLAKNATIQLLIGLRHFNVSLSDNGEDAFTFSEQYYWLNTDEALEDALRQGIPSAILNVVEHFSFQKPSSIWPFSRRYFLIGHFTSYMLWFAAALWIIFNIVVYAVLAYAGVILSVTGLFMVIANLSFSAIRTYKQPPIHLEYESEDKFLNLEYGWSFWLCLFVGLFCIASGMVIFYMTTYYPKQIYGFFMIPRDEDENTDPEEIVEDDDYDDDYFEKREKEPAPSYTTSAAKANEAFQKDSASIEMKPKSRRVISFKDSPIVQR